MVDDGNGIEVSPDVERRMGRLASNPGSYGRTVSETTYAGDPRVDASIAEMRARGFDPVTGNYTAGARQHYPVLSRKPVSQQPAQPSGLAERELPFFVKRAGPR